jgi:hypothetical protein
VLPCRPYCGIRCSSRTDSAGSSQSVLGR